MLRKKFAVVAMALILGLSVVPAVEVGAYNCANGTTAYFAYECTGNSMHPEIPSSGLYEEISRRYMFDIEGVDHLPEQCATRVLSNSELGRLEYLNLVNVGDSRDLKGVELLTGLKTLRFVNGWQAPPLADGLSFAKNVALEDLEINGGKAASYDVSKNQKLTRFALYDSSEVDKVNVTNNPLLENLVLGDPDIRLRFTIHKELPGYEIYDEYVYGYDNGPKITNLDLSQNKRLKTLSLAAPYLPELDLSQNPELTNILIDAVNLKSLNVGNSVNLQSLVLLRSALDSLDVSRFTNLQRLALVEPNFDTIDLRKNTEILGLVADGIKVIPAVEIEEDGNGGGTIDLNPRKYIHEVVEGDTYAYNAETKIVIIDDLQAFKEGPGIEVVNDGSVPLRGSSHAQYYPPEYDNYHLVFVEEEPEVVAEVPKVPNTGAGILKAVSAVLVSVAVIPAVMGATYALRQQYTRVAHRPKFTKRNNKDRK